MLDSQQHYGEYAIWDAPTRWLRWINALGVLLLVLVRLVFMF